ncbi:unnamed protein product, partial [Sphacelaria rigidula]
MLLIHVSVALFVAQCGGTHLPAILWRPPLINEMREAERVQCFCWTQGSPLPTEFRLKQSPAMITSCFPLSQHTSLAYEYTDLLFMMMVMMTTMMMTIIIAMSMVRTTVKIKFDSHVGKKVPRHSPSEGLYY